MQFKLPHWVIVLTAIAAAAFAAMAQQPQFESVAPLLNLLAGVLATTSTTVALHAPSIVHAANLQAVVGYNRNNPSVVSDAAQRGFARVRLLWQLSLFGIAVLVIACATLRAAAPAAQTLEQCVVGWAQTNVTLTFEAMVISLALKCGVDVLDVIEVLATSADPNLAQYKSAALAAKADPAKVGALQMHLLARRHDAGLAQ